MLVRILIVSIGCWWSAISVADCPANQPTGLEFIEKEGRWCYRIDNKDICIDQLKGFRMVSLAPPHADYYYYCGGNWHAQGAGQHRQHSTTGQVPITTQGGTVQQGTTVIGGDGTTGEGTHRIGQ